MYASMNVLLEAQRLRIFGFEMIMNSFHCRMIKGDISVLVKPSHTVADSTE